MNVRIGFVKQLQQVDGYQVCMCDLLGVQWFVIEYEDYVCFVMLLEFEICLLYVVDGVILFVVVIVGEKWRIFEISLIRMNQKQKIDFCLVRMMSKFGVVMYDDVVIDCVWIGFLLVFVWLESMMV